uniref:Uncharacterized protein n=1 Tax=Zea mays TaxID=4577 RepID=C4J3F7_MAIZE|nr:unknown [Zea mays]
MRDCAWFRAMESPTKATCLPRTAERNAAASNAGSGHPSAGCHRQSRYPVSGRPLRMQSWLSFTLHSVALYRRAWPGAHTHFPTA